MEQNYTDILGRLRQEFSFYIDSLSTDEEKIYWVVTFLESLYIIINLLEKIEQEIDLE